MIRFSLIGGLLLVGVISSCQPDEASPVDLRRVLVIGNSITYHPRDLAIGWNADWGMAANAPDKDYFSRLEDSLKNHFPGLQMIRKNVFPFERQFASLDFSQYRQLREFNADLLIIRLGENIPLEDLRDRNLSEGLQKFSTYLTSGNARVIITSTFWPNPLVNAQLSHSAESQGWEFVELSDLGQQTEYMALDEFENESVARHPNNLGMEAIATRIIQQILKNNASHFSKQNSMN